MGSRLRGAWRPAGGASCASVCGSSSGAADAQPRKGDWVPGLRCVHASCMQHSTSCFSSTHPCSPAVPHPPSPYPQVSRNNEAQTTPRRAADAAYFSSQHQQQQAEEQQLHHVQEQQMYEQAVAAQQQQQRYAAELQSSAWRAAADDTTGAGPGGSCLPPWKIP